MIYFFNLNVFVFTGPPKPGSSRKMMGSPRQLENAVPTSRNPHGVWVWSTKILHFRWAIIFAWKKTEKTVNLSLNLYQLKRNHWSTSKKRHTEVTKFDNHDRDTTNKHHCVNLCSATIWTKLTMVDY